MSIHDAISSDQAGEIELAAAEYERVHAAGETSLQLMLNLAILYWQSTDFGLATAKKLGPEFVRTAARRFPQLLEEARRRFPESTEALFWQRYIAWADLGAPFKSEECRQLLRENPAELVPAMNLFAISDGAEAEPEARELLRRSDGTLRWQYITSVIEGVMKRAGLRP